MRVARFAVAGVTIAIGCAISAGGCGLGVLDVPSGASVEPNGDASSSGRGDSGELHPEPGTTDDAGDGGSSDAAVDAEDGGPCANECSSCAGGVCRIDCPGPKCSPTINCPLGQACRVVCSGASACASTVIGCPIGNSCAVICDKAESCKNISVNAGTAAAFCVKCTGNSACSDFNCNTPLSNTCTRACGANGDNDKACENMNQCGTCTAVTDCP